MEHQAVARDQALAAVTSRVHGMRRQGKLRDSV
jgi:hypothetical protein